MTANRFPKSADSLAGSATVSSSLANDGIRRSIPVTMTEDSESNELPVLTCDDWLAHALTCEASSRWFSSFHTESRTHVPA